MYALEVVLRQLHLGSGIIIQWCGIIHLFPTLSLWHHWSTETAMVGVCTQESGNSADQGLCPRPVGQFQCRVSPSLLTQPGRFLLPLRHQKEYWHYPHDHICVVSRTCTGIIDSVLIWRTLSLAYFCHVTILGRICYTCHYSCKENFSSPYALMGQTNFRRSQQN